MDSLVFFVVVLLLLVTRAQQQQPRECPTSTSPPSSSSSLLSAVPEKNSESTSDDDDNDFLTMGRLASLLAASKFRNIVVLNGAGVSVSAGIPDFRTPGTGLYSTLEQYNLPYPEAIFELDYFRRNPKPFVDVAQSIWPGQEEGPKPTLAHSFVSLLNRKSMLRRVYTQNIDGLESLAGVPDDKLVECHGHFRSCSCIASPGCNTYTKIDVNDCRDSYLNKGEVYRCPECDGLVKPDIVFFGETMPQTFADNLDDDMDECDLLVVMGTSLLVNPVAMIPKFVMPDAPRILINRELVGDFQIQAVTNPNARKRDVFFEGDCNDGVRKLCELAGEDWVNDLEEIHKATKSK